MNESNLLYTKEEAIRMFSVEEAVKVTLQDEAMYAGSTLKLADQIYKFITTGEVAQGIK
jgi:hypothetical protein